MDSYGITVQDYNKMFEEQGGRCKICGRHQSVLEKRLNVDHDHVTGNVRSLLCGFCNTALGSFNDSTELLQKAIEYINEHKEKKT